MNPTQLLAYIGIVSAVVAILGGGGLLGWWWRKEPERKKERERNAAMADAILGEPAVPDLGGGTIQPARPGLVHLQRDNSERLSKVEEAVIEFRHAIGIYTEVLKRLDSAETDIAALKNTNIKDIVAAAERAATAAAATEALRLIRERDTTDGEATEPPADLG